MIEKEIRPQSLAEEVIVKMTQMNEDFKEASKPFEYVQFDEGYTKLADKYKNLFANINYELHNDFEKSRYVALVKTKIEEAYMWVGKQIRDEQIKEAGDGNPV